MNLPDAVFQNGIGATLPVKVSNADVWGAAVTNFKKFPFQFGWQSRRSEITVKMKANEAQKVAGDLKFLLFGTMLPPYIANSSETLDPSQEWPYKYNIKYFWVVVEAKEIWLYNSSTGEILGRYKPQP